MSGRATPTLDELADQCADRTKDPRGWVIARCAFQRIAELESALTRLQDALRDIRDPVIVRPFASLSQHELERELGRVQETARRALLPEPRSYPSHREGYDPKVDWPERYRDDGPI